MTDLVVRVYNVRFGDAVLVTIPETSGGHAVKRNILFDFGNALGTAGGQDDVFGPVIDDIALKLAGKPLDLYVMTHEHLDHVQGLYHAATNLNKRIEVEQVVERTGVDARRRVRKVDLGDRPRIGSEVVEVGVVADPKAGR